jgi:hypothetical protein
MYRLQSYHRSMRFGVFELDTRHHLSSVEMSREERKHSSYSAELKRVRDGLGELFFLLTVHVTGPAMTKRLDETRLFPSSALHGHPRGPEHQPTIPNPKFAQSSSDQTTTPGHNSPRYYSIASRQVVPP